MSFLSNGSDNHIVAARGSNEPCKIGRTIADPNAHKTLRLLAQTRNPSNGIPPFVTKSGPRQGHHLPSSSDSLEWEQKHCDEDDSSSETEESSDDILSSPCPTFDYGEFPVQPDTVPPTLEIPSNRWVWPFRSSMAVASYHRTPSAPPINKAQIAASDPAQVQKCTGGFQTIQAPVSLEKPSSASTVGIKMPPWLVHFLRDFQREANRRRIADASFSQPRNRNLFQGCISLSLLSSNLTIRWVCSLPASCFSDRLAFLEQMTAQQLPAPTSVCPDERTATSHSPQAFKTDKEYRNKLLNVIRGNGGCMSSQLSVGRQLDRIESRRRQLLAIVPHISNSHHFDMVSKQDDHKHIPQERWEMALFLAFCAWQHFKLPCQPDNSEQPQMDARDLLNDHSMVIDPPEYREDKEYDRAVIKVPMIEDFDIEAGAKHCGQPKQASLAKTTHGDASNDSVIALKRVKTDLNNVLLEEKSRRIKARAKELAMLQRFGLCSGQHSQEDYLSESKQTDVVSDATTHNSTHFRPNGLSDRTRLPLRCQSPSSLDGTLTRIRIPCTGGNFASKDRQLSKKRKYDAGHVHQDDPRAKIRQLSSLTNPRAEEGKESVDDSEDTDLPSQSPSSLDYGAASSTHSLNIEVVNKPYSLASRSLPLSYDDDVELSDRAKAMLQALENGRFQRANTDLSSNSIGHVGRTDTVVTRKESKNERRRRRKEAKEKRKAEKKKWNKVKRSKIPFNSMATPSSGFPSVAPCHRSEGDQFIVTIETQVEKQIEVPKTNKPEVTYLQKIDLTFPQGASCVPTLKPEDKFHFDHNTLSPTDSHRKHQQYRPASPRQETMIPSLDLTPPDSSSTQAQTNFSANVENKTRQEQEISPIKLLCSESFVEHWGDVVARLATGSWSAPYEGTRICFLDTSLVDHVGVDIETEVQGAVIVCLLSVTLQSGLSRLLKRVVNIAALARYSTLDVVICVDIDEELSTNVIAGLQNAVLRHRGAPKTLVSIHLASPRSLASCLVDVLLVDGNVSGSCDDVTFIEHHIENQKTRERLRFLLSIVPSLSVRKGFQIVGLLSDTEGSDAWLQNLLDGVNMQKSPMSDVVPSNVCEQLSFALSTSLAL